MHFFLELYDTRGPQGGGTRGLGGAPQGGTPTWAPSRYNSNILRFWNNLELFFKHNKQKNGTDCTWGSSRANGGCFGGVLGPQEPLSLDWSRFLYLLCLDDYSKTFQKRRIFDLLLEGAHVGVPPWGGPPEAPGTHPGAPGCHRVLEKIAKILKNYKTNLHASKYPK